MERNQGFTDSIAESFAISNKCDGIISSDAIAQTDCLFKTIKT